jgi:hypothetical protein
MLRQALDQHYLAASNATRVPKRLHSQHRRRNAICCGAAITAIAGGLRPPRARSRRSPCAFPVRRIRCPGQ